MVTESFKILQGESSLSSLSSLYSSYITALLPLNILGIPSAGNERRTVREHQNQKYAYGHDPIGQLLSITI